jgi:uncharacterized protein
MNPNHGEPPTGPRVPPYPATRFDHAVPPQPPPAAPDYPADQAFEPGNGLPWSPISRRYTWHRRIRAVLWAVPIALVGAFLLLRGGGPVSAVLGLTAVVVSVGLAFVVAELAYRSYGYAERPDDLLVTHGVFVKRLIVVPYGRMQFVDVTAGLLEQWMGIATVRMHTAAAATDALIPGLPAPVAARLRDRLAQKGEQRSVGL